MVETRQDLPEDAQKFLGDVETFQRDILSKYPGAIGISVVVNWDAQSQQYPKCVIETNPNKISDTEVQGPAVAMHDLLVNSGGRLMRQLLDHAINELHILHNRVVELEGATPDTE